MKKNLTKLLLIVSLLFFTGSAFGELVVLNPDDASPEEVVLARKCAKKTMMANFKELKGKMEAGNIKEIAGNAKTIAALATSLPLMYKTTYSEVYPISGSKYHYKGGDLAGFVQATQNVFDEAQTLAKLSESNDASGVEAQVPKLLASCKACHATFRGSN